MRPSDRWFFIFQRRYRCSSTFPSSSRAGIEVDHLQRALRRLWSPLGRESFPCHEGQGKSSFSEGCSSTSCASARFRAASNFSSSAQQDPVYVYDWRSSKDQASSSCSARSFPGGRASGAFGGDGDGQARLGSHFTFSACATEGSDIFGGSNSSRWTSRARSRQLFFSRPVLERVSEKGDVDCGLCEQTGGFLLKVAQNAFKRLKPTETLPQDLPSFQGKAVFTKWRSSLFGSGHVAPLQHGRYDGGRRSDWGLRSFLLSLNKRIRRLECLRRSLRPPTLG